MGPVPDSPEAWPGLGRRARHEIATSPVPGKKRERVDSDGPASEATSTEKQGNLNAADVIRCSSSFRQLA